MKLFKSMLLASAMMFGANIAMAESITGAGSTFGAPIYSKWAEAAKSSIGVDLNYQAVGSGAGINQINNRTVDFGASDMPLSADKLAANHLVQVPTVMGGIDVIVNLPGVAVNQLKLSNENLVDIYLGKINKWNDSKIVADNPNIKLPSLTIAPIYRADGSGTTFVFTSFLSKVSTDWKPGASTSISWPVGSGGKGNDGVSAEVHRLSGAIGYVESAYANNNKLTTVQLQTANKKWVSPTDETFVNSAKQADWAHAQNFAVDLLLQPGDNSWPIMSATFVLIPDDAKDPNQTKAVIKWLNWAFANGNPQANALEYIPLPTEVKTKVMDKLTDLK